MTLTASSPILYPRSLAAHEASYQRRDPTQVSALIAALLAPLGSAAPPVDAPARLSAALAILGASAELLAQTAPTALSNAPGIEPLAAHEPNAGLSPDAATATAVAEVLGNILGAAAVRLPLPTFFMQLPGLRAILRDAIANRLGNDHKLFPRDVIHLTQRLVQAIGAGDADTTHQAIWALRHHLTRSLPPRSLRLDARSRLRSRPIPL